MKLFLGVDEGATKTVATVIDESGKLIYKVRGKGTSYHTFGVKRIEDNLYRLLSFIKKKKLKISYTCFGLAQIDSKKDHKIVYSMLNKGKIKRLLKCPTILLNDSHIILPSIGIENGVVAIGGTGCNFYARNGDREARASGRDYILSDEGSAFDIGVRVLRAAVRSFDGRGNKTILERMVLEKARVKNMEDLVDVIYKNPEKSIIAVYAPLAEKAALAGDKIAKHILSTAANEYVLGIKAVSKRVGLRRFDTALIGGVFETKFLLNEVKKGVSKFAKAKFFLVKDSSLGAARLAMKEFQRLHSH